MSYFDGYILAVPKDKKQAYIELAKTSAQIFIDYGAIRVLETWGDDIPRGQVTDFFMAVKAEEHEGIVLSYVEWPDKATRDIGFEKVMSDPRCPPFETMPFNTKTMIFGGFESICDVKA